MAFPFRCLLLLALAQGTAVAQADEAPGKGPHEAFLVKDNFAGFLNAHPDLMYYRLGMQASRDNARDKALRYFLRAARYADKPSQALVAEMYWKGIGVAENRPLAYAWMDLAAERGCARLLAMREQYWQALSPEQQAQAVREGRGVYAEYGDAVARPRLETVLRRAKSGVAGSRTGYTGNLTVLGLMPGASDVGAGGNSVPPMAALAGSSFYDPKYWEPKAYFAWRQQLWEREIGEVRQGTIDVGPLEPLRPVSGKQEIP